MSKKLSIGIVGLPNVGKSTLFNALTKNEVAAQNYPFCTIDPNVGIVPVPDPRLQVLADISSSQKCLPATIEFVDIAGLVEGASKGEGLGNQFLSHIRQTSVIAHVVRCFDSTDITHVYNRVDPVGDFEVISSELILADLALVQQLQTTYEKKAKSHCKDAQKLNACLAFIETELQKGNGLNSVILTDEQRLQLEPFNFITLKKHVFIANVAEDMLGKSNQYLDNLRAYTQKNNDELIVLSAALEEECATLTDDEKADYLQSLGVTQSGLDQLAVCCFRLLNLQTYLTTGPKETRAWTILKGMTAPQAAGVIHTDFEKGFIRANVVSYDDFKACNGLKEAKTKGLLRQEGRDYIMQDGDVVEFLFNV